MNNQLKFAFISDSLFSSQKSINKITPTTENANQVHKLDYIYSQTKLNKTDFNKLIDIQTYKYCNKTWKSSRYKSHLQQMKDNFE